MDNDWRRFDDVVHLGGCGCDYGICLGANKEWKEKGQGRATARAANKGSRGKKMNEGHHGGADSEKRTTDGVRMGKRESHEVATL